MIEGIENKKQTLMWVLICHQMMVRLWNGLDWAFQKFCFSYDAAIDLLHSLPLSKYYERVIKITHSTVKDLYVPDHFFYSTDFFIVAYQQQRVYFQFSFSDFNAIQ